VAATNQPMTPTPPNPPSMPDWRLLDAWLAGTATPEERAVVQQWMAADPRHPAMLEALGAGVREVEAPRPDVDRAWAATRERMHAAVPITRTAVRRRKAFAWRIAAGIIAAVG